MALVSPAIYAALVADATLVGLIASYGGAAAIFTFEPVPGDATRPYIVTAGAVSDTHEDTKTDDRRDVLQDVTAVAENDGNPDALDAITKRIREVLHRQDLTIDGQEAYDVRVSGPIYTPSDDTVRAETLSVRARYKEA